MLQAPNAVFRVFFSMSLAVQDPDLPWPSRKEWNAEVFENNTESFKRLTVTFPGGPEYAGRPLLCTEATDRDPSTRHLLSSITEVLSLSP